MKKILFFVMIILTMTSCMGQIQQNIIPRPGQYVPGRVYFIPNNVSQTQAYVNVNGYVGLYNQTVPTIDKSYRWTWVEYVLVPGGPKITAMAMYRISNFTTYRDLPYGQDGMSGYIATFVNSGFQTDALGCTEYVVDPYGNAVCRGQAIFIRLD